MIILLTAAAVLIMGVPFAVAILVTFASRHEDHARSIAGRAPGNLTGAARRVLGFGATGIARPAHRALPRHRNTEVWLGDEPADDPADLSDRPALAGGPMSLR
jgi:hypothetical protein